MKTLHLNLKKKWFDMILSGEKKEEYRDTTYYWERRIVNTLSSGVKLITFSNGYAKNRRQMVVELSCMRLGCGRRDWGAECDKTYFVILLGDVLEKINC